MKLWIIDDSNKTASCVLLDDESQVLGMVIEDALLRRDSELSTLRHVSLKNLALRLSKLGLKIEGL